MLDENLHQIEQELLRLPLRRPPDSLDRRITQAGVYALAAQRRRRILFRSALCLVAAACLLAVAAVVDWRQPGGQQAGSVFPDGTAYIAPIQIEQVWSSVATEPDMLEGEGQAVRVQHHVVRQIRWIDEARNIRIQWDFPSVHTETMPLQYEQWPVEYN